MKRFLFYSKKTVCLLLVLILTAAFVPAVYAAEPEADLLLQRQLFFIIRQKIKRTSAHNVRRAGFSVKRNLRHSR